MTAARSVKGGSTKPQIVAVISSGEELRRAVRLRRRPDAVELRLDCLRDVMDNVYAALGKLAAPLIVTARHPREGGANSLNAAARRNLLLPLIGHAAYIDVELRAVRELAVVVEATARAKRRLIISVHNFDGTPTARRLRDYAERSKAAGADIFKLATRISTPAELERVLAFFEAERRRTRISVMGLGPLGRASRIEFFARGSALNYAHLGAPRADGQLSLAEMRRLKSFR